MSETNTLKVWKICVQGLETGTKSDVLLRLKGRARANFSEREVELGQSLNWSQVVRTSLDQNTNGQRGPLGFIYNIYNLTSENHNTQVVL